MIFANNTVLTLVAWIAQRCGLALDLPAGPIVDRVDEREVAAELHYGRD